MILRNKNQNLELMIPRTRAFPDLLGNWEKNSLILEEKKNSTILGKIVPFLAKLGKFIY